MTISGPLVVFVLAFAIALLVTIETPCCSVIAAKAASEL